MACRLSTRAAGSRRTTPRRATRLVAALVLCSVPVAGAGFSPQAGQLDPAGRSLAAPKKKDAATRLAEPWPTDEQIKARREKATALPLFGAHDPLVFTLATDLEALNRDRLVDSPNRYPAVLTVKAADGADRAIAVQVGARGNLRLNRRTCDFVPILVEFPPKKELAGTVFEGQDSLKLVTHCRNQTVYEQYVRSEYLAYRIFNLITPLSFRARLATVTYVDSRTGNPVTTRTGMFVEDDADVARRAEGRIIPFKNRLFRHLDLETLTTMAIFQFMIGNTDYSIFRLHNIRLVQDRLGAFHAITYDFDLSGLVNARYALPDRALRLRSVRDRLYRGPCRTVEEYEPLLARFREKKADVLGLFDMPELEQDYRQQARAFLEDFYRSIEKPSDIKWNFVDRCPKTDGM